MCHQNEVEALSVLCKVMTVHELALDIVSLHARINLILANVLAFAEDFECESVGE